MTALQAMLGGILDYAGLFPPARLAMGPTVRNYAAFRRGPHAWMLGRLIVPAARLAEFAEAFEAECGSQPEHGPWRLTLLGRGGDDRAAFEAGLAADIAAWKAACTRLPGLVEGGVWEIRLPATAVLADQVAEGPLAFAALAQSALTSALGTGLRLALEVPFVESWTTAVPRAIEAIARAGRAAADHDVQLAAKIRTGSIEPAQVPGVPQVARFIAACAVAGLAFKATAGLHHPVRHLDPALGVPAHGFLNVFGAAAFARLRGWDESRLATVLEDDDAAAFDFEAGGFRWRDERIEAADLAAVRRTFALGLGSCSFDEPLADLQARGWLAGAGGNTIMIFAKDSTDGSWLDGAEGSEFPLQNLPYGVFRRPGEPARIGVALGPAVIDLAALHYSGLFDGTSVATENVFARPALNDFLARGRKAWTEVRTRLVALLATEEVSAADGTVVAADGRLRESGELRRLALRSRAEVELLVPARIRAYVDFYSSREHATNVGKMFRDPANPLLPNWLHLPIGYNGRASSVVVSGTPVRRPCGQTRADDADAPTFGPSRLLDIELEMGFLTGGPGNPLGTRLTPEAAVEHIFGMVLVNDWSARDIQRWEYQPLGPFLAKSFATSVSPWVVPLDALQPFRVPAPPQDPAPLPYLQVPGDWALDIELEILLAEASGSPQRIAATNFRHMYWTIVQQLVHQASNGTNVEPGDLYASGTVSGSTPDAYGSLLELTWRGSKPLTLASGQTRRFLADGDTVSLRGRAVAPQFQVGFGEVTGTIFPAE